MGSSLISRQKNVRMHISLISPLGYFRSTSTVLYTKMTFSLAQYMSMLQEIPGTYSVKTDKYLKMKSTYNYNHAMTYDLKGW